MPRPRPRRATTNHLLQANLSDPNVSPTKISQIRIFRNEAKVGAFAASGRIAGDGLDCGFRGGQPACPYMPCLNEVLLLINHVNQVENTLFGIPQGQLMKSEYFREMLQSPCTGEQGEGTEENPICLNELSGVSASEMECFVRILETR